MREKLISQPFSQKTALIVAKLFTPQTHTQVQECVWKVDRETLLPMRPRRDQSPVDSFVGIQF